MKSPNLPGMEYQYLFKTPQQQSLFLHTLSDSLSDAIIIIDKDFIIEYVNQAACQLFTISVNEVIGNSFMHLLSADHDLFFSETISQHVTAHKSWEGILSFTKTTGNEHALPVTILPVNEELIGIAGYMIISRQDHPKENQLTRENISKEEIILSEQKWRSLLDNTRGAIFLIDTNYQIILVNEKGQKILDHSLPSPVVPGQPVYLPDLLPKERQEPVKKIFSQVLKGERIEYEVFYTKSNKENLWLLVSCMPVKNNKGEVNQICMTTYNITNLKEKEAALIRSEQRWKFALDGARDGVWEYNFQTKESYFSPLYKAMLGFSEDEFSNREYEWKTRVHPDDFYKISDIDTLYETGAIENHSVEYRLRNKIGEYLWILDRGMVLERTQDGRPWKLIGTHTNITERKKAEEQLKKSEQRFSSFMANTPTITWIIDEYTIFRFLNASYLRSFNLTEKAAGKSIYEVFPAEMSDRFIETNKKVWETNSAVELMEEVVGPDGVKRNYQIFKFPLDPENGVRLLGGVALDITKRLELEKQLAAEEAQKKRDVIHAIINAQEKERKEISYELHDNVNQILSSSRLMLEVAAEKPELSKEFIHRCLAYLKQTIAEIRKISHNLVPVALTDISLEAAIEDVVENINATGKLDIAFYKNLNGLKKEIDPEKQLAVLRIIQEQFNNILKHAHASEATISLIADDKKLFLEMQDNGKGFDQQSTKKGLGFNNIVNRVEFYQGSVHLTSAEGKGCNLQVEIPI
jgi:PAS domain S-box-containing protein